MVVELRNTIKSAFIYILPIFIILNTQALAEEESILETANLDEIIEKVKMQQARLDEEIEDAVFFADAKYREIDNDGKLKKSLIARRRVYLGQDDKRYEEVLSMLLNGEELKGKELREQFDDWNKKTKSQSETKMPMTPEGEGAYDYSLIGSGIQDSLDVWIVSFTPKKKKKGYIEGKGYISKDDFGIVRIDFSPAKLPRVMKNMNMSLSYSEIEGHWLPVKFEMKMTISVGLMVEVFRRSVEVEDVYSNYRFNNKLDDSLFER